jgi:hypothetical protein
MYKRLDFYDENVKPVISGAPVKEIVYRVSPFGFNTSIIPSSVKVPNSNLAT